MKNKFIVRRNFILGISFLSLLTLSGCFSYYPQKEPLNNSVSKLKLKNGSELIFSDDSNKLNEITAQNIVYQNSNGESYSIPISEIEQWYDYKFNIQKTFFALLFGAMGIIFLLVLLMPPISIG